ncbi:acylpyruvase FAHD1, mitochondrial [Macrosteles quadrilineatus]|uniref:acylpyruvase FAHD1, mitochondrial n=1 Tax=Macrosteles quadrilineatus TaxID=74068 RepID=UPI0023E31BB2|nr:acylpyruvase FAHD1, mitochondrial [Macrosteles quadrilineatus]
MTSSNVEFWKLGKKIAGAGLNYKALCLERKLPIPKTPVIFLKPTSSYIIEGQNIEIPKEFVVKEEIELGVIIGKKCKNIKPSQVVDHIMGYCLALDLTSTSFLDEARAKGLPWALGKGFDTACPVSSFIPKEAIPDPDNVNLWCRVNGELKQDANTSDMIFSVGELISYISSLMTLEPYDLILTGSSKGVAEIKPGDIVEGGLEHLVKFKFPVKSA